MLTTWKTCETIDDETSILVYIVPKVVTEFDVIPVMFIISLLFSNMFGFKQEILIRDMSDESTRNEQILFASIHLAL